MSTTTHALKKRTALQFARLPVLGPKVVERHLRRKYNERVVTPAKVENFILAQREMLDRTVEVRSLPWILNLDTFSGCNLKCPFCPTGTGQMERRRAQLPIEHAMRMIDLVKDHALEVRLYNWGEPFLNPEIFEIIRYARDAGLFTVISSNLSVKVKDLPRKVVDSGLDRLTASIDGISQKALETYRRKADAALCFDNIKAIADEKARQGVDHPSIELRFLVFRHNEHELGQLEAKRQALGADLFEPRRAFIFHESFIPRHPDFAPIRDVFEHTCDFLYAELTVEATGAVSPCCTNTSSQWDVGRLDAIDGDLRRFWNSPIYRAMRAFHAGHPDAESLAPGQPLLCKTCDLVAHPGRRPGPLSPLPPSFQAAGITYAHGLDAHQNRQIG